MRHRLVAQAPEKQCTIVKERQDVVSEEKYIELRLLARLDETAGIEDKREEKLGKLSLFHK